MPRYTDAAGVVVNIPAELAEQLGGYTPTDVAHTDHRHLIVTGPGAGGGGGGGAASDPNTVGIDGYTLAQWADWLEAEEDYHAVVETWLEAEEAHKVAADAAGKTPGAANDRRTGRK